MRKNPSVRSIDVLRLAAEAQRDPRTVKAVIEGRASGMSRSSVEDAAKRLNIELPAAKTDDEEEDD